MTSPADRPNDAPLSLDHLAELHLPRIIRVRAAGRTLVLAKRAGESTAHVLLKAIGYARYLPDYPGLRVEAPIGTRYKPDLVALGDDGTPMIWIECMHVDLGKVRKLVRRYPRTHLVWLRRQGQVAGAVRIVEDALVGVRRAAPLEILGVPDDALVSLAQTSDADAATRRVTVQRFGG